MSSVSTFTFWVLFCFAAILGAAVRFFTQSYFQLGFPWGVLIVNSVGGFLAGFLVAYPLQSINGIAWNTIAAVGFLGALTTFSSFSADTLRLALQGQWISSIINVLLNNIVALFLCWMGFLTARKFL